MTGRFKFNFLKNKNLYSEVWLYRDHGTFTENKFGIKTTKEHQSQTSSGRKCWMLIS